MREMPLLDALLRRRLYILAALGLFMYVGSSADMPPDNDWLFFTWGGDLLFGEHYPFIRSGDNIPATAPGGLHLYANYPFLQIGPPAILLGKLLQLGPRDGLYVGGALVQILGFLAVVMLDRSFADGTRRHGLNVLVGGALVTVLWVGLTHTTHIDDALTLAALAGASLALTRDRTLVAGALLGLAAASKPWGVVLLALALAAASWRARLTSIVAALGVIGAFWAPFVLADPQTLGVGAVDLYVLPASVLSLVGEGQYVAHPSVLRLAQFGVGLLLAVAIVVFSGRWPLAPLAAFGVRLLIDPGPYQYYTTSLVLAALLADMARRATIPLFTTAVAACWLTVEVARTDHQAAWVRLVTYTVVLGAVLLLALAARRGSTDLRNDANGRSHDCADAD